MHLPKFSKLVTTIIYLCNNSIAFGSIRALFAGFHTGFFVRGGKDLLNFSHIRGRSGPAEIMTSEIQNVCAHKLVVNKFQHVLSY